MTPFRRHTVLSLKARRARPSAKYVRVYYQRGATHGVATCTRCGDSGNVPIPYGDAPMRFEHVCRPRAERKPN